MANHPSSNYRGIGNAGEDLVTQWLQSIGWIILHRQWRCRFGEIDIIAQMSEETRRMKQAEVLDSVPNSFISTFDSTSTYSYPILAFVEVKTRSRGNLDVGGRSAIAFSKQEKLWRTAEMFLTQYPEKADYDCRFDVAIVCCQRTSKKTNAETEAKQEVRGYDLILEEYIPGAFLGNY
ncbi:MAG: YraN family protein [Scytonematopsis contorta HA4267-MV1]|jgi:putative endonuclease|nr:YraN family protein [Scytonematopsis contorta HA4267-MV1]